MDHIKNAVSVFVIILNKIILSFGKLALCNLQVLSITLTAIFKYPDHMKYSISMSALQVKLLKQ